MNCTIFWIHMIDIFLIESTHFWRFELFKIWILEMIEEPISLNVSFFPSLSLKYDGFTFLVDFFFLVLEREIIIVLSYINHHMAWFSIDCMYSESCQSCLSIVIYSHIIFTEMVILSFCSHTKIETESETL